MSESEQTHDVFDAIDKSIDAVNRSDSDVDARSITVDECVVDVTPMVDSAGVSVEVSVRDTDDVNNPDTLLDNMCSMIEDHLNDHPTVSGQVQWLPAGADSYYTLVTF